MEIGKSDLNAVENFLGSKKYLFGDKPCLEDAVIFSLTAQVFYNDYGPLNEYFKGKDIKKKYLKLILIIFIYKLKKNAQIWLVI